MKQRLIIEGWLDYAQSFAVIAGNHLIDLQRRGVSGLAFRELPPPPPDRLRVGRSWPKARIWNEQQTAVLTGIPRVGPECPADVVLRIGFPYNLLPDLHADRTLTFAVTEDRALSWGMVREDQQHQVSLDNTTFITPSSWSRDGLIASGADPDRVHIVPHGVDTDLFRPLDETDRKTLRQRLGWNDDFVVLNVSSQYRWKGIDLLLQVFAEFAARRRNVRLMLKGTDDIYTSRVGIERRIARLTPRQRLHLGNTLHYTGHSLTPVRLAELYQAADMLLAPYHAEGFNMPVLEAMACGLTVICTAGGPTDDFIHEECVLRIPSEQRPGPDPGSTWLYPDPVQTLKLLHQVYDDVDFRQAARGAGPAHVRRGYGWHQVTDRLLGIPGILPDIASGQGDRDPA